jgi:hyperosmotically inducible periplasmic protein
MNINRTVKTSGLALAFLLGTLGAVRARAQSADPQTKPDNTAVNKRDRDPAEATADQQKMNSADRTLTAKIRRSIVSDKSLSTYAHNVKVISQNGTVTLKGPVHSDDEATTIVSKATYEAGSSYKVVNQLTVKP